MKIIPVYTSGAYEFRVEYNDKKYTARIWMNNASSKFQDWEIVDSRGEKANFDVEENILEYIGNNWENLSQA